MYGLAAYAASASTITLLLITLMRCIPLIRPSLESPSAGWQFRMDWLYHGYVGSRSLTSLTVVLSRRVHNSSRHAPIAGCNFMLISDFCIAVRE